MKNQRKINEKSMKINETSMKIDLKMSQHIYFTTAFSRVSNRVRKSIQNEPYRTQRLPKVTKAAPKFGFGVFHL